MALQAPLSWIRDFVDPKINPDNLAEKFGIPLLSKVPISETSVEESENGIPILLQENESPTKNALQDLVTKITKVLPPISDETCTGRLAKVLEELEADQ